MLSDTWIYKMSVITLLAELRIKSKVFWCKLFLSETPKWLKLEQNMAEQKKSGYKDAPL